MRSLKLFFIATISSALAMETEMVDVSSLSAPPLHQTEQIAEPSSANPVFIVEPSFSAENEDHYIPARLNTLYDVENIGWEVCCLTTSRKFWTFMTGPLSFLGGVANSVKTALSTTAVVISDNTIKKWLGVAATISSISSFTCNVHLMAQGAPQFHSMNWEKSKKIQPYYRKVYAHYTAFKVQSW